MHKDFEQFIRERRYLSNVTDSTVHWYEQSFLRLNNPNPTEQDLKDFVVRLRKHGLSASSVNTFARAVNAYLRWKGIKLKVPKLRVEERVPEVFSAEDISKFAKWKPTTDSGRRLQTLVLLLADTGLRISEALGLTWRDVNFDDLLLLVKGKGRKERQVPFSYEFRRYLFRHQQKAKHDRVFATRDGQELMHRNVMRDVKNLCKRLNVRPPRRLLHAFRHSFATHAIRLGTNPFVLQRLLGHTTMTMTNKYVTLGTTDLQQGHRSLLG